RVRRVVRVDRLRRLAVHEDAVADHPLRPGEVRVAQAAGAVEVVDRHVDGRVRRQVPHRLALPLPAVLDQVRDPVRIRAELRADGGDRLDLEVHDRMAAARIRDRRCVRRRPRERREVRDVEADHDPGGREGRGDEQELHSGPHRTGSYQERCRRGRLMTNVSSPRHLRVIGDRYRFTAGGRMRILVIEDEARIQAFLTRGLEAEGYTVAAAGDGREGLDLAAGTHWDLVVLDLLLPRLNGLQVLRELHRTKPELPVVILSARSDVQTKLRGFELGATDYLAKPFSLDELLARIRIRLRGAAAFGDEHMLHGGNVVLDVARRQAAVGERTADL